MLHSSELDRRVFLERRNDTAVDPTGQAVPTWVFIAVVWAKKIPLKGKELLSAQQITPYAQEEYVIRYRTDITESCRLTEETGLHLDIIHIAEVGRREGLRLLCKKPGDNSSEGVT